MLDFLIDFIETDWFKMFAFILSDILKSSKERSQKRKKLLAQTLGLSSVEELKHVLGTAEETCSQKRNRDEDDDCPPVSSKKSQPENLFYRDSSTFLKGTQSSNPHNDYCQHFVDTGQRPQNFILDVGLADRFEEYPKLGELIRYLTLLE